MRQTEAKKDWMYQLSLGIISLFGAISLVLLFFGSQFEIVIDMSLSMLPPSRDFLLGTDLLGKSILLKSLYGLKNAVLYGLVAATVATSLGTMLGALGGFFGGVIDGIFLGISSVLDSVPYILLVSAVSLALGQGLLSLAFIVGLTGWMKTFRLVRGEAAVLREANFVAAAEAMGSSRIQQVRRQILPNLMHLVRARFGITFVHAIKLEVVLTFLGIGAQAGATTWGTMINDAQGEISQGAWLSLVVVSMFLSLISLSVQNLANQEAKIGQGKAD